VIAILLTQKMFFLWMCTSYSI